MTDELQLSEAVRRIDEACACGQSGVWVRTAEPNELLLELATLRHRYESETWPLDVQHYDAAFGVRPLGSDATVDPMNSPRLVAAVRAMLAVAETKARDLLNAPESTDDEATRRALGYSLLYVSNAHMEFAGGDIRALIASVQHLLTRGKDARTVVVFQGCPESLPPIEFREATWLLDHALPDERERTEILAAIGSIPVDTDDTAWTQLAKATGGLTRSQVESAAAVSMYRHGQLQADTLLALKCDTVNKGGLLRISYGPETFDDLGGLDGIKQFAELALRSDAPVAAKGILLVGCPGSGKSVIARAIGSRVGRPTLTLDIGRLMGGVVGQTEEQTRRALAVIDAMAPAVLLVDEAEKALGGGGDRDGGVNSRLKGTLLTWMSDRKSDVFVVMTANDISTLPPEFTRSGRFDCVFFVDMPSTVQRDAIWEIHLRRYKLDTAAQRPTGACWTGADIEQCCRAAQQWRCSLLEASTRIVPTYTRYRERIDAVRQWANKATLDAQTALPYAYDVTTAKQDNSEFETALGSGVNGRQRRVAAPAKKKAADDSSRN